MIVSFTAWTGAPSLVEVSDKTTFDWVTLDIVVTSFNDKTLFEVVLPGGVESKLINVVLFVGKTLVDWAALEAPLFGSKVGDSLEVEVIFKIKCVTPERIVEGLLVEVVLLIEIKFVAFLTVDSELNILSEF